MPATVFNASIGLIVGAGVTAAAIVWITGISLGTTLTEYPMLQTGMTWAGIALLTWVSWQIYRESPSEIPDGSQASTGTRIGLMGGAGLQFINPKAWMMAIAVISVFLPDSPDRNYYVGVYSLTFLAVSLPCMVLWALLGCGAARIISTPQQMKIFNTLMALLLLLSTWANLII
ncbi:LysE family translocator [Budvicia aquatica]|uniref:Homoserine/homoserine lactone efflux protein n=1 Tax=Budvicia aquatica TaxID=82979 RepID=A0A484ZPW2_9GAMM|nr:LysE family transporter [Budvicia aquatica]VFS49856.1 Homoserine/homoserine lactone efflux protein [Budvicia aquatica]